MLIVEGADCVGKTTFVKKACELLDKHGLRHDQKHMTRPPEDCDHYRFYAEKTYTFSAWDRFHLGELVYRMHDDRASSMTPLKFDLVESLVRLACGFVVVITAEPHVIAERFGRKAEMYDLPHAIKVNETYGRLVSHKGTWMMRKRDYHPRVDYWVYDAARCDVEHIVDLYARQLREFKQL